MLFDIREMLRNLEAARQNALAGRAGTVDLGDYGAGEASPEASGARVSLPGPHGPVTTRWFRAGPTAPDDFPSDLPFLPDVEFAVIEANPTHRIVSWIKLPDPVASFDEIARQMEAEGWTQRRDRTLPLSLGRESDFARGDLTRCLQISGTFGGRRHLTLIEKAKG